METADDDEREASGPAGSTGPTLTRGADDETLVAGTEGAGPLRELETGASVGRFVVLGRLGAGGMGVVYVAYDPELGRKVAIKLLRTDRFPASATTEGGGRLLREAQAMAKVSHANVITVHDVGTIEDQVWVAMEFVEGKTLSGWLREAPRSWVEVLRQFVSAGRGLAAVHAADLVHRDFKPENVMVGEDGRVLVMDFGLAASGTAKLAILDDAPDDTSVTESSIFSGGVVGTPAYMAPEQLAGLAVDARADQFAFCVALWEALFGQRPYAGSTLFELANAVLEGKLREPPSGRTVPGWLRRAVTRGLAKHPDRRWPSMQALLEALERGQSAARQRWLMAAGATSLVVVGAVWGVGRLEEGEVRAACAAQASDVEQIWNPGRADAVRAALGSTGHPGADQTADRAIPWIDRWAADWASARTEACLDTRLRKVWNEDRLDRAAWCLEEQLRDLSGLVDALVEDPARAVGDAVQAAAELPVVDRCVDERRLALASAPPSEGRDEVRAIREQLAIASKHASQAEFEPAIELATQALERAKVLGWAPLRASAQLQLANVHEHVGDYDAAEQMMIDAYFDGAASGASLVAGAAATDLAWLVGYRQARFDEGRLWARQAEVELARAGEEGGLEEASRLNSLSAIAYATGSWEDARANAAKAMAIRERIRGGDHPSLAQSLSNVAIIDEALGEHARAAESLERAIEIWEKAIGPDHPELANALNNLAIVHHSTRDYAAAEPLFRRAIAIRERALGPEHPATASTRSNLGILLFDAGRLEEAREAFGAALEVQERVYGKDHPDLADAVSGLGRVAVEQGRLDEGRPLLERALELFEKNPAAPLDRARAQLALARVLVEASDELDRARGLAKAARDASEKAGPDGADLRRQAEQWLADHP